MPFSTSTAKPKWEHKLGKHRKILVQTVEVPRCDESRRSRNYPRNMAGCGLPRLDSGRWPSISVEYFRNYTCVWRVRLAPDSCSWDSGAFLEADSLSMELRFSTFHQIFSPKSPVCICGVSWRGRSPKRKLTAVGSRAIHTFCDVFCKVRPPICRKKFEEHSRNE